MTIKPNLRKVFFTALIALSASSFIYVNSQYEICPVGWGDSVPLLEEQVQQDAEQDGSFFTLPDLSMLEKTVDLLQRLTRH